MYFLVTVFQPRDDLGWRKVEKRREEEENLFLGSVK